MAIEIYRVTWERAYVANTYAYTDSVQIMIVAYANVGLPMGLPIVSIQATQFCAGEKRTCYQIKAGVQVDMKIITGY